MPRIAFVLFFTLLFHSAFAQGDPGIWAGAGDYKPGESITNLLKGMGGEKKIVLQINANNEVTGTLDVTYDKAAATNKTDMVDVSFILSGKYDSLKQILLLAVTHIKATSSSAADRPFKRPDSLFYDVKIGRQQGKIEMTGKAGDKLNKYTHAEWLGSGKNFVLGLTISEKINMHILPLNIRLEKFVAFSEETAPVSAAAPVTGNTTPAPVVQAPQIDKRKPEIQHTILLDTSFIRLDMYDNGEVDGDIATLILDGNVILNSQPLSTKAVSISVNLSKDQPEHLLELYANNLGNIPPNTALLVLTCNRKRYEINLSSNGTQNGSVKLVFTSK